MGRSTVYNDKEVRSYYTAADIRDLMGVSRSKAYNTIRDMREELLSQGRISEWYPSGKVPKKYVEEKCLL